MKKYLLAGLAVVLAGPVSATETFSGAYAGAQVGVSHSIIKQKGTATTGPVINLRTGATQFGGNVLLGYGAVMDSLYVGAEADVGMNLGESTTDETIATTTTAYKYANKDSYGISARFGYLLTQKAMVYLSLGAAYETNSYTISSGASSLTKKKRSIAPVVGLGTEIAMSEELSLRIDAKYTLGGEVKFSKTDMATAGRPQYAECKFKPNRLAFRVGLAYRF